MFFKPSLSIVMSALLCAGALPAANAQTPVYQCGSGKSVTYSEKPCLGGRVVDTGDAPVPAKPRSKGEDARRAEQNRVMAQSMRKRDGESAEQFETRRRRAMLAETDRNECARLDKRIPVEESGLTNPDKAEVVKAEAALVKSRERFAKLGC